ncbi:MAG: CHASE domain-containing protein, partial [Rhodoferax sp.]|nr:CHASE domain-containing protein [Rhodoferax sp.]
MRLRALRLPAMRPAPQRRFLPWVTPLWIGLIGIVATALVTGWLAHRIETDTQAAFERVAQQVARDIRRRFTTPVYGLRGLAGTYAASQRVTSPEFRAYVEARDMDGEFPGVRGFGFIERVADEDLPAWLDEAQADLGSALTVRSLSDRPPSPSYIIRYIEPVDRNAGARGLDVGSETHRRAAVERAIDSGNVALTEPITLVQDQRQTPGFLVCVPLYANGRDPSTPAQRRAALRGVLYAPIVAAELLAEVSQSAGNGHADFVLSAGAPIFVSGVSTPGGHAAAPHRLEMTVDVLDRRFALSLTSTPTFEATVDRSPLWLTAVGGSAITLLLVGLARANDAARWRAERRVEEMTAELTRLAAVARATSDGVMLLDAQRRIVWVNDAFMRVTGYTLDEVRGRQPSRLLDSDAGDADRLAAMRQALDEGQPCRVELRNRRKDRSRYWTDVEIQPQRDDAGAITGWIAVESDITQRRETELALASALRDNHALLDTIRQHAIVSIADRSGRIIEVNDAFCR